MCTRVIYTLNDNTTSYTGRNMDWAVTPEPQIWAYPSKVDRTGVAGNDTPQWTSKYSSITTANFGVSTSDGVNEKGLAANLLWLGTSSYPNSTLQTSAKPISISIWVQYILDLCATVGEAIEAMKNVYIVAAIIPDTDSVVQCHLSVSDSDGNSAIFEYVDGQLHISSNLQLDYPPHYYQQYTKSQVRVMTNDPIFEKQIKLNEYWAFLNNDNKANGLPAQLPGSSVSSARFVRASYYCNLLSEKNEETYALAELASVMHNAATPIIGDDGSASNNSTTWYTTLASQSNPGYFYQSAYSPFMIWLELNEIDFSSCDVQEKQGLHLALDDNGAYTGDGRFMAGDIVNNLKPQTGFEFLAADFSI
jgi:penicillin V acylase-like amidase (Ntn superfamily)